MKEHLVKFSYKDAPTIKKFSESRATYRGLMGPLGSGKSSACVVEIVKKGLEQAPGRDGVRRTRWAVIRNTYRMLQDTTVRTFHHWFPPHVFGEWKVSEQRYIITAFENCEIEILFRALDRPDQIGNLLSMELTGAWVNEAREVPWALIEALQSRTDRFPAVERDKDGNKIGGATWSGVILDTNPPDSDSRWFKFFEEPHDPPLPEGFAEIFKQPGGLSEQAENLTNHNNGRGYYEKIALGKDPEWRKVYVDGEYGFVIDGKPVFPEFVDHWHVQKVSYIPHVEILRGWDFGLTPACVLCQLSPKGTFHVIKEFVADNLGFDQFADMVISECAVAYPDARFVDVGDPAGTQRAQTDEKTIFQLAYSKGIEMQAGPQTVAIRLEAVKKALRQSDRDKSFFKLDPSCKHLRKALQGGYQYKRMATSDERYMSVPNKNTYSHVADALQYACGHVFGDTLTIHAQDNMGHVIAQDEFLNNNSRNEITGY